ncbi:uncharacterized protein METZ01_LOCUS412936, partial [marine metagenome]
VFRRFVFFEKLFKLHRKPITYCGWNPVDAVAFAQRVSQIVPVVYGWLVGTPLIHPHQLPTTIGNHSSVTALRGLHTTPIGFSITL